MNHNKKIERLKSEGLSPNLLTSLTEAQITSLYNRLLESKKKEFEEQTQTGVTTKVTTEKITTIAPTALNSQQGVNVNGVNLKNQGGQLVAKELGESDEISEKFESKAQQGLFWARCNKCKTDDCKWCKMAKEFSKSTSKKQYKSMPEKKHPEKTVKYKKKETKEGYMDNVGKKVTDTYAKKFASFTPGLAWGGMKENYNKIIEKYTEPTMKKKELLKLIENQIRNRKSLNEDFYFDEEIDEDFDMMSRYEEDDDNDYTKVGPKRPDYTEVSPKRREIERHWDDDDDFDPDEDFDMPDPDEAPKARRLRRMSPEPAVHPGPGPLTIPQEPGTKPDKKPIFVPEPDERETIDPKEDPGIQGEDPYRKRYFKKDFDKIMSRMNESYYKPVKYRKY